MSLKFRVIKGFIMHDDIMPIFDINDKNPLIFAFRLASKYINFLFKQHTRIHLKTPRKA